LQNFGQFIILPIPSEAQRYFEQFVQRFPSQNDGLAQILGKNKLPTMGRNRMGFSCFKLLVATKNQPTYHRKSRFRKLDKTFFKKTAPLCSLSSPFKFNGNNRMVTGHFFSKS
jgi:hypothetical protein